jgi:hypothetical protein
MTTTSARIRALHAAEPELPRAELARRVGTNRQLVNQALGTANRTATSRSPKKDRRPPAPARPMDGTEMRACMDAAGVSRGWLAGWWGLAPSNVYARTRGRKSITAAEAILLRLLASGEISLDRVVSLSAADPEGNG